MKLLHCLTLPARLARMLPLLAALAGTLATAQAADFEIRTANLRRVGDAWALTARIDYHLTAKALEALDNGVTLTFHVELVADRVRGWMPDAEALRHRHDRQLSYEPLTERYTVRYGDGREPTSHGTLFGALNALGRLQDVPVAGADVLVAGQLYEVAVRAVLDQKTLPGPLQVFAFWSGGFSLESDWYEWTLRP